MFNKLHLLIIRKIMLLMNVSSRNLHVLMYRSMFHLFEYCLLEMLHFFTNMNDRESKCVLFSAFFFKKNIYIVLSILSNVNNEYCLSFLFHFSLDTVILSSI